MRLACPSPISRVAGPMSILGCCDPTPGSWADCPQSRVRAVVCAGARPHAALTLQRSLLPQCGASLTVLCCTLHAHQGIVLACPQQRDHALKAEACSAARRSLRPTRGPSRGTLHSVRTLPHMQAPASDEKLTSQNGLHTGHPQATHSLWPELLHSAQSQPLPTTQPGHLLSAPHPLCWYTRDMAIKNEQIAGRSRSQNTRDLHALKAAYLACIGSSHRSTTQRCTPCRPCLHCFHATYFWKQHSGALAARQE